jgi:response regulator of citrate/malate metabolism
MSLETSMPTRVILIEDDPWVMLLNRTMLEAEKDFCVVGEAETVKRGLAIAKTLEPDLLLVDVYLPDGSGLELVHQLRNENLPFEAIMITAANDLESVQRALRDGALDYLIKPFQQSRLRLALERFRTRESMTQKDKQFTQFKLDRLLGQTSERLPKGVDATTLEQVQDLLLTATEPLSADELGVQVGLSRVTAWRYLEHLRTTGVVTLEVAHGTVGRPSKRYGLVKRVKN